MRTEEEKELELNRIKDDPDWSVRFDVIWWSRGKAEAEIRELLKSLTNIITEHGSPRDFAKNQTYWALRWILKEE